MGICFGAPAEMLAADDGALEAIETGMETGAEAVLFSLSVENSTEVGRLDDAEGLIGSSFFGSILTSEDQFSHLKMKHFIEHQTRLDGPALGIRTPP